MKARNALNRPNTDRSSPRRLSRSRPLLFGALLLAAGCAEGPTTPPLDVPDELAFVIARTSDYGLVWGLNTESGGVSGSTRVEKFTGGESEGVAVTPDGTKAYVAHNDESGRVSVIDRVSLLDRGSDAVTATIPLDSHPRSIAVTPDGAKVFVTSQNDVDQSAQLTVIVPATESVVARIPVGGSFASWARGLAVSPDGTTVYVAVSEWEGSDYVSVVDVPTGAVTDTILVGKQPYSIAVTPDGTKVFVTNRGSEDISVIDTASGVVTATIPMDSHLRSIAVTPDGTKAYVNTNSGISVIEVATGTVTATVPVVGSGLAVTTDGTKVYAASLQGISVIEVSSDTITRTINLGGWPLGIAIG